MQIYGPVPSRRLGRSLGIDHVPPGTCTYSCTYCQVGRTRHLVPDRREFHPPAAIVATVEDRLVELKQQHVLVDTLTFLPEGEPALDAGLGAAIEGVHRTGLPVAVMTNGSLMDRPSVRADLSGANWISVKVDAVDEATWHRINRPHGFLDLASVLEGIQRFAAEFRGTLVTETMLVAGVNDSADHAHRLATYLGRIRTRRAYLSVPTRPPAESGIHGPDAETLTIFERIVREQVRDVELLIGYEGDDFATTGDPAEAILAIASVHPMREGAVRSTLERRGAPWQVVEELVDEGRLARVDHEGHTYYLRRPAGV